MLSAACALWTHPGLVTASVRPAWPSGPHKRHIYSQTRSGIDQLFMIRPASGTILTTGAQKSSGKHQSNNCARDHGNSSLCVILFILCRPIFQRVASAAARWRGPAGHFDSKCASSTRQAFICAPALTHRATHTNGLLFLCWIACALWDRAREREGFYARRFLEGEHTPFPFWTNNSGARAIHKQIKWRRACESKGFYGMATWKL